MEAVNDNQNEKTPAAPVALPAERCGNCKFFYFDNTGAGNNGGMCRRFPPQLAVLPVMSVQGPTVKAVPLYPGMHQDDWCGEWAKDSSAADGQEVQQP